MAKKIDSYANYAPWTCMM